MDLDQIKDLVKFCKLQNICKIEVDGLKITFAAAEIKAMPVEEIVPKPSLKAHEPSDEELLFYSTPHYDEIQLSKEMALNEND